MDSTDLQIIVKDSGLEQTKAQIILDKFSGFFKLAAEWEARAKTIVVTSELNVDEMALARTGRLLLREKRLSIERTRKDLKEQSLREGKAIDGIANVLKGLIEPIEEYLEAQEKFVETRDRKKAEEASRVEAIRAEEERIKAETKQREEYARAEAENTRLRAEAEKNAKKLREAEVETRKAQDKAAFEKRAAEDKIRRERDAAEFAARMAEKKRKEEEEKAAAKLATEKKKREKAERALAGFLTCPSCGHEFKLDK